jgi:cytoskeletal protein CcmA (bactofilin family)
MAYIGVSPSNGVRQKHTYTATASQTTFSGAGAEGVSLSYRDSNYVDVYVNGVKLGDADYTATSGTSIVFDPGLPVNDIVEVIVYDVFSVADTVSKADGGVFDGNVTMAGNLSVDGNLDVTGSLDMSDANLTNVGSIQLDSISGDADTNTSITFSGSDVITVATGGSTAFTVDASQDVNLSGSLTFADNEKAIFGAGSDLQIYHDGSHSYIDEQGTGNLIIRATSFRLNNSADTQNMIVGTDNAEVSLFWQGSSRLNTKSDGVNITGELQADSLDVDGAADISGQVNFHSNVVMDDNNKLIIGNGSDLQIYHDGSNSYIQDEGTGILAITTNGAAIELAKNGYEKMVRAEIDGAVSLYYDASTYATPKLATTSTGIDVTGGFTATDGCTITTADNTAQLTLVSTDADSNFGPVIKMYRNSSSPADADFLGDIEFQGENSAGETITYAQVFGRTGDVTDGTEDGRIATKIMVAGVSQNVLDIKSDEIVINDDSVDLDFRIESDGNVHMFFVDAANNKIGINYSQPQYPLHVNGTLHTGIAGTSSGDVTGTLSIGNTGNNYMTLIKAINTASTPGILKTRMGFFTLSGTGEEASHATEKMSILADSGNVLIGLTSSNTSSEALQVYRNGATALSVARQQDGTIVNFRVGSLNGAAHGSISISGTTCSYNAFSGSHWSRLSDNSKPTILKGTIIETIDEMCDWYRAEFTVPATGEEDEYVRSESIALPSGKSVGDTITYTYEETDYTATITQESDEKHVKCKISDTADSTRVYGVFSAWDNDDDSVNDMYVTAVGTHVVRVHSSATVSSGDLLVSNGDGTAKVQDDDIIRSKTIGKVLTNIVQETYDDGSYTVPCALYCG